MHNLDIAPVDCLLLPKGELKRLACPKINAAKYILEFGEDKTPCSEGAIALEGALKEFQIDEQCIQFPQVKKKLQNETENEGMQSKSSNIPDDVALILTSSGSTGLPKGVMLTHDNIIAALKLR